MGKKTFEGLIKVGSWGEAEDVVFVVSPDEQELEPFARELYYQFDDKKVTARYWVSDKLAPKEEIQKSHAMQVMGIMNAEFTSYYSEITGYLWTDQWALITDEEYGVNLKYERHNLSKLGHDLIAELKSFKGMWLVLEIEEHE